MRRLVHNPAIPAVAAPTSVFVHSTWTRLPTGTEEQYAIPGGAAWAVPAPAVADTAATAIPETTAPKAGKRLTILPKSNKGISPRLCCIGIVFATLSAAELGSHTREGVSSGGCAVYWNIPGRSCVLVRCDQCSEIVVDGPVEQDQRREWCGVGVVDRAGAPAPGPRPSPRCSRQATKVQAGGPCTRPHSAP
jgi:hypothetical protein